MFRLLGFTQLIGTSGKSSLSHVTVGTKSRLLPEWSVHRWLLVLVLVSIVVRVAWILYVRTIPVSDFASYDARGWRIAEGEGFVDSRGEASSFQGVGYPAFLAGIYFVWGHSVLAAQFVNALLGGLTVLLTFGVARRLLSDRRALLAAAVVALTPSLIMYSSVLATENLFTVLFIGFLWLIWPTPRFRYNLSVLLLAGVLLGLSWLVRPTLVLFPIALVLMLMTIRTHWRRAIGLPVVVGVIALIVVIPWAVRNVVVMDTLSLDTAGGVNFWIGNGPHATGTYAKLPDDNPLDAYTTEAERNQAGFRLGLEYITDQPGDWVGDFPRKFWHLWVSDMSAVNWSTQATERTVSAAATRALEVVAQGYWMLLVLLMAPAILTAMARPKSASPLSVLVVGVLVYWSLFHFMGFGVGRFHIPVIPLIAIVAADLLYDLVGQARERVRIEGAD